MPRRGVRDVGVKSLHKIPENLLKVQLQIILSEINKETA